jgi:hypothetical protein
MSASKSSNKHKQHFLELGEKATRTWLIGARCALKDSQRKVAAAEHVLKKFERAKKRKPESKKEQAHG